MLYHIQRLDPIWTYQEALDYSYATRGNSCYLQFVCSDATISVPKVGFLLFSSLIRQVVNRFESDTLHLPDISSQAIRHLSNILSSGNTNISRGDMIKDIIFAAECLGVHLQNLSFGTKRIKKIVVGTSRDVNDRNNNNTFEDLDEDYSDELVIDSEPELTNAVNVKLEPSETQDYWNKFFVSESILKTEDDFSQWRKSTILGQKVKLFFIFQCNFFSTYATDLSNMSFERSFQCLSKYLA